MRATSQPLELRAAPAAAHRAQFFPRDGAAGGGGGGLGGGGVQKWVIQMEKESVGLWSHWTKWMSAIKDILIGSCAYNNSFKCLCESSPPTDEQLCH